MIKHAIILILVLCAVASLIAFSADTPEHLALSKVIALPGDYNPKQFYPPYSGPHPSNIKRPDETYNFPIRPGEVGPVQPLFAGPLEYPFLCRTEEANLGQPLIDNHEGAGIKIFELDENGEKTPKVIGFSKDCMIPTRIIYMAKNKASQAFQQLDETLENAFIDHTNEIETLTINGKKVKFIVRVEVGTINRQPYLIGMLKGNDDTIDKPDAQYWNKKLIYRFRGGVGIGKRQGRIDINHILGRSQEQLANGYAVIHSSANQTSISYDIWLSEDTALRVKQQFVSQYGKPEYTVGIGGSGGAIQQYLLAQNNPEIIDAAIALYSYPDMLTQIPYALDCELLEYFFDVTDATNPSWKNWENRKWIEGMNSNNDAYNRYSKAIAYAGLLKFKWPEISTGMTECTNAWRGLTPLIFNPNFPILPDRFSPTVQSVAQLSYWDNLKRYYGTDTQGNPYITWDNVGVQYGLGALKEGNISIETFLKLNARIGGWKKPQNMEREYFWFFSGDFWPSNFSVWSHHNMNLDSDNNIPVPRTQGDIDAMQAAYRSGQIFLGKIDLPVIDLRHYLDDKLNMHHSFASFSTRARMLAAQGHADNQVIWQTKKPHTPIPEAYAAIDRWMQNIKNNPAKTIVENKPADIMDKCFDDNGQIIAEGYDVWNGRWNNKKTGACTKIYPPYKTSRMVAGGSMSYDILKCQLQSVKQAIDKGIYAPIDMAQHQKQLEQTFHNKVCDYSKPDAGRPTNI